jgi:N-acetylmuramoyl-L-alanine amidase
LLATIKKPRAGFIVIRFLLASALCCVLGAGLLAMPPGERAVSLEEQWRGAVTLSVPLDAAVPYRVFTLTAPYRLIVDVKQPAAPLADPTALAAHDSIEKLRLGGFTPGWTRMVVDLAGPYHPENVALVRSAGQTAAVLEIALARVSPEDFARKAGPPPALKQHEVAPPQRRDDTSFLVVIDPGHGGIDPGAQRAGLSEKALVLEIAQLLARDLSAHPGIEVHLTREADVFVSLDARVAKAQALHADLFLSLHADALPDGGARGATIYTLAERASDAATAQLAARHNRADVLAGVDLTGTEDAVAQLLLDLARRETRPRSARLAQTLARELASGGVPMNNRPLREAGFSVLKSADTPSVLIEVGFLSNPRDRANLQDPAWRQRVVESLGRAVTTWREKDTALRAEALR